MNYLWGRRCHTCLRPTSCLHCLHLRSPCQRANWRLSEQWNIFSFCEFCYWGLPEIFLERMWALHNTLTQTHTLTLSPSTCGPINKALRLCLRHSASQLFHNQLPNRSFHHQQQKIYGKNFMG